MQFSKEVEGIDVIINRVVKDSLKDNIIVLPQIKRPTFLGRAFLYAK